MSKMGGTRGGITRRMTVGIVVGCRNGLVGTGWANSYLC